MQRRLSNVVCWFNVNGLRIRIRIHEQELRIQDLDGVD